MALFGKKTEEKKKVAKKAATLPVKKAVPSHRILDVIGPRITEKATLATDNNVYVFNVATAATKETVKEAIKLLYKVDAHKVNIVRIAPRAFMSRMRGRKGQKSGYKKAYVFLKKGDKIEFV